MKFLTINASAWTAKSLSQLETTIAQFLMERNADFVFLCEMSAGGQIGRIARIAGYPVWHETVSYPHHTPTLAVGWLLKTEPESIRDFPLYRCSEGEHNGTNVRLRLADDVTGNLYGVHLWNMDQIGKSVLGIGLGELWGENPRTQQVTTLLDDAERAAMASVVVGDFNTFPGSKAYCRMRRRYKDSCPLHACWRGTYRHQGLRPRLDYIMHSWELARREYRVIALDWSDHDAVEADLELSGSKHSFPE